MFIIEKTQASFNGKYSEPLNKIREFAVSLVENIYKVDFILGKYPPNKHGLYHARECFVANRIPDHISTEDNSVILF